MEIINCSNCKRKLVKDTQDGIVKYLCGDCRKKRIEFLEEEIYELKKELNFWERSLK